MNEDWPINIFMYFYVYFNVSVTLSLILLYYCCDVYGPCYLSQIKYDLGPTLRSSRCCPKITHHTE